MNTPICPICGSRVRAPDATPYSRLHCKKCHTPFYVDESGCSVVGDPPYRDDIERVKQQLREKLEQVPVKRVAFGLAGAVFVCVALYYLFRPAERLDRAAEEAARAFASNDVASLKSIAAPDTEGDVVRWFDQTYPRLVQAREKWNGKAEAIAVQVAQEDQGARKGVVAVSIHPIMQGGAFDVSLANPSEATANATTPFDLQLGWTLDKWGRWKLDGRETSAKSSH